MNEALERVINVAQASTYVRDIAGVHLIAMWVTEREQTARSLARTYGLAFDATSTTSDEQIATALDALQFVFEISARMHAGEQAPWEKRLATPSRSAKRKTKSLSLAQKIRRAFGW